jgi:hypothetical protein
MQALPALGAESEDGGVGGVDLAGSGVMAVVTASEAEALEMFLEFLFQCVTIFRQVRSTFRPWFHKLTIRISGTLFLELLLLLPLLLFLWLLLLLFLLRFGSLLLLLRLWLLLLNMTRRRYGHVDGMYLRILVVDGKVHRNVEEAGDLFGLAF